MEQLLVGAERIHTQGLGDLFTEIQILVVIVPELGGHS